MAKEKKLTMTAAVNAAKEAAMQGRNDGFAALADFKEKLKPNVKLEIVERAAAYCDADGVRAAVNALGLAPGDLASALCVAYRNGNEETTRALYELGGSLGYSSFDVRTRIEKLLGKRDGSIDYKHALRHSAIGYGGHLLIKQFFEPCEEAGFAAARNLLERLIDERAVPSEDAVFMAFDVLEAPYPEEPERAIALWEKAEAIYDAASLNPAPDMKRLIGPKRCNDAIFDYGLSRATEEMVKEVFETGKSSFVQIPDRLSKVIPYLTGDEIDTKTKLVEVLAENGYVESLRIVANWPDAFTEKNLDNAVEAARSCGQAEAVAYLLEERRARYGDPADLVL